MQIKYIAKCHKTDSITGVGLSWAPGQTREVTPEVAEKLLHHTDTWIKGDDRPSDEPPISLREVEKQDDEPLPVVDFHAMSKDALIEYAQTQFNQKYPKNWGEEVIRERVIKRHSELAMDQLEGK
ncbi:MAG: hypothetical protein ABI216_22100 [Devosia sp.]